MAPKRKAATAVKEQPKEKPTSRATKTQPAQSGGPPAKRGRRVRVVTEQRGEQNAEPQIEQLADQHIEPQLHDQNPAQSTPQEQSGLPQQQSHIRQQPHQHQEAADASNRPFSIDIEEFAAADVSEQTNVENMREWRNSTTLPNRPRIISDLPVDPTLRLAEVLERTLNSIRDASLGEGNSRLVNRLTTAKALPQFSGDPLEWHHFKEAYQLSSELGDYTDRENRARLFEALKGPAREAVSTLLSSSRDANAIMRTLELNFGNKKFIAEKIVTDLKKLPHLESGQINLVQFATKLRNAVIALKTLSLFGYLQSPELFKSVGAKLPSALKYSYNRYAANDVSNASHLEKLSDFLYAEAELADDAGLLDIDIGPDTSARKANTKTRKVANTYTVNRESENEKGVGKNCVICGRDNHQTDKCFTLKKETLEQRWALARKHKLCFGCLKPGHTRSKCRNASCNLCKRNHHTLLHNPRYAVNSTSENNVESPDNELGTRRANSNSNNKESA